MDDGVTSARALADRVRYSGDMLRRKTAGDETATIRARNMFFHNGLQISPSVTPNLANRLTLVCDRLQIPQDSVHAFIYASPEIQAECFAGTTSFCVLRFSSALVDLLNDDEFEFVAGHELGHFLLDHGIVRLENQDENLEFQIQERAQEISADRIGLISCQSLEVAIQSLMKTVSGLSREHLRFDIGAFLSQLRNVREEVGEGSHFATHPSILIRCRALLWFSLNDLFTRKFDQSSVELLEQLDQRILKDMDRFIDAPSRIIIDDARENLSIWVAASHAVADGVFDKNEQTVFADMFGISILERLKSFLSDLPASEVEEAVFDRMKSAREDLEQIIPSGFNQVYAEIQEQVKTRFV
jgi:hypothetical protein